MYYNYFYLEILKFQTLLLNPFFQKEATFNLLSKLNSLTYYF